MREKIDLILKDDELCRDEKVDQIISTLRYNGWVHLDDVVEGKTVYTAGLALPPSLKGEELAWEMNKEHDRIQPRPATIRDLIGGK